MKRAFADTYYFLALLGKRDHAHAAATAFNRQFVGNVITSDWILTELGNAMAVGQKRRRFVELVDFIGMNSAYEIVRASTEDFDAGAALFRSRDDKEWSLTDCISFAIMSRLRIQDAITGDHHFTQAGFNLLLGNVAS